MESSDRSEVIRLVHLTRARLRARILWGTALTVLVPALPLLAAASALPSVQWLAWGVGVAALLLALASKSQALPGDAEAARWMDERLDAKGLLIAAAHCALQNLDTPASRAVLAQAADLLGSRGKALRRPLPWRPVVTKGVLATGLAGVVWAAVIFLPSVWKGGADPGAPGNTLTILTPAEVTQEALESRLDPESAQRLRDYPQFAGLAEQALAADDLDGLRDLLDQAQAGGDDPFQPGAPSFPENSRPQNALSFRPALEQPVAGSNTETPSTQPGTNGDPSPQDNPGSDPTASERGGLSKDGLPQGQKGEASSSAGNGTGEGHSERRQGVVDGTSSKGTLQSADPFLAGRFEIRLPGKDAKLGVQQALAATARSSEAALQASKTPLEYESAIQDYFLRLSAQEQP